MLISALFRLDRVEDNQNIEVLKSAEDFVPDDKLDSAFLSDIKESGVKVPAKQDELSDRCFSIKLSWFQVFQQHG